MGSSVFHGAFSTFLAITVLSQSKSYIFEVFFKMWYGIIIFAVCNGFFLLPVILSLIGPINETEIEQKQSKSITNQTAIFPEKVLEKDIQIDPEIHDNKTARH